MDYVDFSLLNLRLV